MSVYSLLDTVADALRPKKDVFRVLEEVLAEINKQLMLREITARASAGGSVAKNTFLRTSYDVDIFVRFDPSYPDSKLSDLLGECVKKFDAQRVHGSRDYFQFTYRGFDFEIVPVINISDPNKARNVTDASPLHVEYFLQHGAGLEDEVRLAKQFLKSHELYGAESYIRGFSGHVVDLLIIHYESFYKLMQHAASWSDPVIIDIEQHHTHPLLAIDRSKHSPIILVDPMQPLRNAAAALSEKQFLRFINLAQEFLRAPDKSFFLRPDFSLQNLKKELSETPHILLEVSHPSDDKKDVAGARVRKFYERLGQEFVRAGFEVVRHDWHFAFTQSSYAWYCFAQLPLSKQQVQEGPPVEKDEHFERFSEQHEEVYVEGERSYAVVARDFRTPSELLESIGSELESQISVSYRVLDEFLATTPEQ